jgi:hypothetical protein
MSTSGRGCLNASNGKPSYLSIESTTAIFSGSTTVDSVEDTVNGITWDPKPKWRSNAKVLPIRLFGKGHSFKIPLPDSGTVTVTTSNPSTSTDVTVSYVDDSTP